MKANYHSHTKFSDGSAEMFDFIEKVIENGYGSFGISDHSPVPFESEWNMKFEDFWKYLKRLRSAKRQFKDKLDLYAGLEADFFEEFDNIAYFRQFGFDYIIGGVHYFTDELDGVPFNLDKSVETFTDGLNRVFGCNVEEMVFSYYDLVIKMIERNKPDIVAHLNLIEKFNFGDRFFNPLSDWYVAKIKEVLSAVAKNNLILELNCRSKYKGLQDDFAPSLWIVRMAKEYNIPFVIAGDVHKPEELDIFWEDAVKGLKDAGYEEYLILKENKWVPVKI